MRRITIPIFYLSKPSEDSIRAFISAQTGQRFSYAEVGRSREQAPDTYTIDHNRIQLGTGSEVFGRAKKAVRRWAMFNMPWMQLCWPDTPIHANATVAVLVSHLGFWSLNACRIVYVLEEQDALEKYGFAYGTLPEHGAIGEERFTVEYHTADQSVWYDVYAFSRPRALARLAYPFSRSLQKRFARDSKAAMQRAIQSSSFAKS